ncbi:unnamed protein product, partial [Brenthis ino]
MVDGNMRGTINDFFGGKPPAFIYEDNQCMVFEEEFSPQAPIHFLVVPKNIITHFSVATGHLLIVARKVAVDKGLDKNGFHVVVDEDIKTSRFKCLHVFGRSLQHMMWPTGPGSRL